MIGLAWLAAAVASGVAAYLAGWPAWRSYRARETRDANVDRYLAWRGRADRHTSTPIGEGLTGEERRRLWIAGALAIVALVCLAAFFAAS